jgi:TPP-dependent pyruvate/acetoin dehydrogenase alpha subunit
VTETERARYDELLAKFNLDHYIAGQELVEYALLYFANRGDDSALAEYRTHYGVQI